MDFGARDVSRRPETPRIMLFLLILVEFTAHGAGTPGCPNLHRAAGQMLNVRGDSTPTRGTQERPEAEAYGARCRPVLRAEVARAAVSAASVERASSEDRDS